MNAERIAELRRLCDAATPPPWRGDRLDGTVKYDIIGANHEVVVHGDNGNASDADYNYGTTNENDERFIITSRTAVPELLAEVERLQARNNLLIDAIELSGYDIYACSDCGNIIVGVPDGISYCQKCCEKGGAK